MINEVLMLKWTPCDAYANDPVYPPAEAWSLVMKYMDTISELRLEHKDFTLQFTKRYNPRLFITKSMGGIRNDHSE